MPLVNRAGMVNRKAEVNHFRGRDEGEGKDVHGRRM